MVHEICNPKCIKPNIIFYLGYIGYFSVIAGFFWLTVISYDLWISFCDNYHVRQSGIIQRFKMYSLYAWGCSFIFTIIIMIIDSSLDQSNENELAWMPGVGVYNCWVKGRSVSIVKLQSNNRISPYNRITADDWSAMLYFHGLMAIQIIFNTVMFILTVN